MSSATRLGFLQNASFRSRVRAQSSLHGTYLHLHASHKTHHSPYSLKSCVFALLLSHFSDISFTALNALKRVILLTRIIVLLRSESWDYFLFVTPIAA